MPLEAMNSSTLSKFFGVRSLTSKLSLDQDKNVSILLSKSRSDVQLLFKPYIWQNLRKNTITCYDRIT